jgi:hypothetical protein
MADRRGEKGVRGKERKEEGKMENDDDGVCAEYWWGCCVR